jgi:hypothetical protein
MVSMYFLEIQAENLPRYVGTFNTRADADYWAATHVRTGSWSIVPLAHPEDF